MKNIQYNYKKVKSKNIRNEINKINYKTSNEIIKKSNKNFSSNSTQAHDIISSKIKNIETKKLLIKKCNNNLILINRHKNKENNFKTKKNIIRPITNPSERIFPLEKNLNNIRYKTNSNHAHNFFSNQKGSTFSNFNINKIIPLSNPRSISKSPKRNNSANPKYKNKEQLKLIDSIQKNQIKQYQKLSQFYQNEKEINQKYSLFSFPEKNEKSIYNKLNIKNKAQIPLEYFGNYLDTYCKEEKTLEFQIVPNFMEKQEEINAKMRAIVVNWMIDVHDRFKLLPDTLFLGVVFFDRYMSTVFDIKKEKLQLIGVTSLLIACKYEEIFSPEIRDFVCILDRTYERDDLIELENYMLKILKFEITFPTSFRYYEILRIEFDIEDKYYNYGIYLLTLCLIDCRFAKYTQGVIATTVCFFLKKIFYGVNINEFLGNFVKIEENEIKNCLIDICFLLFNVENSIYTSINIKFKNISEEIISKVKIKL